MATVTKQGNKWKAQIRRRGLGSATRSFIKKADAEAWARSTEAAIEAGTFETKAEPDAACSDPKQVTLGQLMERYRDTVSQTKKGAYRESKVFDAFLRDHSAMAKKTLATVSVTDWCKYRDARLKQIKPNSLKRQFVVFQHMYSIASTEWGYDITNPFDKVKLEFVDTQRIRRLKDGELDQILAEAGKRKNKLLVPIIQWFVCTGMRRSEVLALQWEHVNLKARELSIPESKNGHARQLPVTREMMAILEGLDTIDNPHVFPISDANFKSTWKRILTKLGLHGDLRAHDLRREGVSRFFEAGLEVQEVSVLSGHRTWSQLKRYTAPKIANILRKLEPELA